MAYVTLDDYLDQVRELLVIAHELEISTEKPTRNVVKMLRLGLQRIESELAAGESSRAKLRAHKARKRAEKGPADTPLWGEL